jgi:hypothetical protein
MTNEEKAYIDEIIDGEGNIGTANAILFIWWRRGESKPGGRQPYLVLSSCLSICNKVSISNQKGLLGHFSRGSHPSILLIKPTLIRVGFINEKLGKYRCRPKVSYLPELFLLFQNI